MYLVRIWNQSRLEEISHVSSISIVSLWKAPVRKIRDGHKGGVGEAGIGTRIAFPGPSPLPVNSKLALLPPYARGGHAFAGQQGDPCNYFIDFGVLLGFEVKLWLYSSLKPRLPSPRVKPELMVTSME